MRFWAGSSGRCGPRGWGLVKDLKDAKDLEDLSSVSLWSLVSFYWTAFTCSAPASVRKYQVPAAFGLIQPFSTMP